MSSGKTHNIVGGLSGGAYALMRAPSGQPPLNTFAEVLGGAVGGILGAKLPDLIEPAIHSYHRSTFHSVAAIGTVSYGALQTQVNPAAILRETAALARQRAVMARATGQSPLLDQLMELLFHLLAGALAGAAAGYVSHLVCDATTPRSIPLFTRGF